MLKTGLFTVPTRIVIVIAPINALMNWLFVWGPEPIRLGFVGAPLATALRYFRDVLVGPHAFPIFSSLSQL